MPGQPDELVSRITREVVSRLGNEGAGSLAPGPGVAVVLTNAERDIPCLLAQLRALEECHGPLTIIISKLALYRLDLYKIRQAARRARILRSDSIDDVNDVLKSIASVYVPDLNIEVASRIAHLMSDGDNATRLVIEALRARRKVIAPTRYMGERGGALGDVPQAIRERHCKVMEELERYGVCFTDELAPSEPAEGHTSGKSVPLPSSTGACALLMAGGECESCGLCVQTRKDTVMQILDSGATRIGAAPGVHVHDPSLAAKIDHTLLKPDATREQITKLCEEARQFTFASVCVNPSNVALAASLLKGTPVKVCTVIGFPLGATTAATKAAEAAEAIENGATEIDMVINVGALKSGDDETVRKDIEAVVKASKPQALVKVIIETALLTDEEKVRACLLSKMAGADFVKTSTGFGPGGATVEDIALMRRTVGPEMGVKASGGIRDTKAAKAMVAAGATRIGASASVAIVKGS